MKPSATTSWSFGLLTIRKPLLPWKGGTRPSAAMFYSGEQPEHGSVTLCINALVIGVHNGISIGMWSQLLCWRVLAQSVFCQAGGFFHSTCKISMCRGCYPLLSIVKNSWICCLSNHGVNMSSRSTFSCFRVLWDKRRVQKSSKCEKVKLKFPRPNCRTRDDSL